MKFLKTILVFLFAAQLCKAQDTTIVLSANMLSNNQINLSKLNGWMFKQGHDTSLAEINVDIIAWKKLKPEQLTSAYKDNNGRVEGWFRIIIKFDSSLLNKQLAVNFPRWAATELYMDGKLLATRGNIDNKGNLRPEYNGDIGPFAVRFETSSPYIFTFHFAGDVSSIPPYELR